MRLWIILFLILSLDSRGQGDVAAFQDRADKLILEYFEAGRFSGEVLLAKEGVVLYLHRQLDPGLQKPEEAGDHPLFCLASVSKPWRRFLRRWW